jgi:predicted lipoprotein with Yx(FWY)xxD motif
MESSSKRPRAGQARWIARTTRTALALSAVTMVAAVAATATVPAGAASTKKVVVSTMTTAKYGKVLTVKGEAIYTLKPSATACTTACLKIWPAVTVPANVAGATAGHGVSKSALGVTTGSGGIRQVTYHGKPVYWFATDTKGHVNGNVTDQWGKWTVVVVGKHPSGSTSSGGSTAGSGGASF